MSLRRKSATSFKGWRRSASTNCLRMRGTCLCPAPQSPFDAYAPSLKTSNVRKRLKPNQNVPCDNTYCVLQVTLASTSKIFTKFSRLQWFLVAPRLMQSKKSFWSSRVIQIPNCLKMPTKAAWVIKLFFQFWSQRLHSKRRPLRACGSILWRLSSCRTRDRRLFVSRGFLQMRPRRPFSIMF